MRCIDDGAAVDLVWNAGVVPFEEILVDAVVLIEQAECGFQPLGKRVNRRTVEALIIYATNFEDYAKFSALGEKNAVAQEAIEVDLSVEGAGFLVVFDDARELKHVSPYES